MQGLDRWRKLFQGNGPKFEQGLSHSAGHDETPGEFEEDLSDEFLPVEELEGWTSGNADLSADSDDEVDIQTDELTFNSSRSDKILPETRRVSGRISKSR